MQNDLIITDVSFREANAADVKTGLCGFIEFTLNGSVRVTGVALRRTRAGRYTLSYPAPRQHPIIAPIDDESREAIEKQVFAALGLTASSR